MSSQVADISPVVKQLNIVVDGGVLTRELDKAYTRLGNTAKIKGFRQGKIPRQVLERYFRKDVEADVLGRVITDEYRKAIIDNKIEPVAQPEINHTEFVPGQDLQFTAKVEVRPTIEIKDYTGLTATRVPPNVTDAQVEEEIERQRQQVATIAQVEGRPVQKGDLVTTNFNGTVDGQGFVGGSGTAYVIEPGAGRFVKEVEEALVGKNVGESFEVDGVIPDTFRTEAVRGKTAHFSVSVVEIKARNLPALDDEFAKDLGDYESLADLRAKVRKGLEERTKAESDNAVREQLMTQLIERNPFEVPPTMVERQVDARLSPILGRMRPQQLQRMGMDLGRMREEQREVAIRQIRGALLLDALATKEKLDPTPEDLEKEFTRLAESSNTTVDRVRAYFAGDRRDELAGRLRHDKALQFLQDHATVTDKAP